VCGSLRMIRFCVLGDEFSPSVLLGVFGIAQLQKGEHLLTCSYPADPPDLYFFGECNNVVPACAHTQSGSTVKIHKIISVINKMPI
jgi:hypothetical protein